MYQTPPFLFWLKGLLAAVLGFAYFLSAASAVELDASPQLKEVTDSLVRAGSYSRDELRTLIGQIEIDKGVLKLMDKQWEAKPWHQYKPIFLNEERIAKGVRFWQDNHVLLDQVSADYGVPQKILVALLGVETYYGKRMGDRSVFVAWSH